MKRFHFNLLNFIHTLLLCLVFTAPVFGQTDYWEPVAGPYGGTIVYDMTKSDDGAILAATQGGIFKLASGDEVWSFESNGLVVQETRALLKVADGTLLAATFGDGVFKKSPTDTAWVGTGLRGVFSTSMAQTPGGVLYAGTVGGLLFSTDGGSNWTETTPVDPQGVSSVALAANDTYVFVGTPQGVYRSDDQGGSWTFVAAGMDNTNITALAINAQGTVFAGTTPLFGGCNVFRSRNAGNSWTCVEPLSEPFQLNTLAVDDQDNVYAGGFRLAYHSDDEGDSWLQGIATETSVMAFGFGDNALYAGTFGRGIVQSTNGGTTWNETNEGVTSSIKDLLALDNEKVVVGTEGGVYTSDDRGKTWQLINDGLNTIAVRALALDGQGQIIAGTTAGAYRFDESLQTWELLGPPANPGIRDLALGPDGSIYSGYFAGIYKLNGSNWTPLEVYGPDNFTRDITSVGVAPDGTLYAGAFFEVYRLEDDGVTWKQLTYNDTIFEGQAILIDDVGTVYVGTRFVGVLRSEDRGESWTRLNGGLTGSEDMQALAFDANGTLYAGTFGSGVIRYSEDTAEWKSINTGLDDLRALSLDIDTAGNVYAGTLGGGLFLHRSELGLPTVSGPSLPAAFMIESVYPNPFYDATNVRLNIAQQANVTVEIYDILGRVIRTTSVGTMPAGEHQQIKIDTSDLAAGVYLGRIIINTKRSTNVLKTTLVKMNR